MKTHKEKIDDLITLEKEDNLFNHISTSFYHKGETIAEKKTNKYVIWKRNYWIGIFYPIFTIYFNDSGEIKEIKTELSLYGKLWRVIFGVLLFSFYLFLLIIPIIENFKNLDFTVFIILGVFGFLGYGFVWVFRGIYKNETKYLLDELKIVIGLDSKENIEQKENEKNEWTLKRTIVRIFIYPFSIFIILISIYGIYKGVFIRGFLGITIALTYLYSDIKVIRKKKKINNK